jgi:hypothetical protein
MKTTIHLSLVLLLSTLPLLLPAQLTLRPQIGVGLTSQTSRFDDDPLRTFDIQIRPRLLLEGGLSAHYPLTEALVCERGSPDSQPGEPSGQQDEPGRLSFQVEAVLLLVLCRNSAWPEYETSHQNSKLGRYGLGLGNQPGRESKTENRYCRSGRPIRGRIGRTPNGFW